MQPRGASGAAAQVCSQACCRGGAGWRPRRPACGRTAAGGGRACWSGPSWDGPAAGAAALPWGPPCWPAWRPSRRHAGRPYGPATGHAPAAAGAAWPARHGSSARLCAPDGEASVPCSAAVCCEFWICCRGGTACWLAACCYSAAAAAPRHTITPDPRLPRALPFRASLPARLQAPCRPSSSSTRAWEALRACPCSTSIRAWLAGPWVCPRACRRSKACRRSRACRPAPCR